jgi:hypothetical protein
LGAGKTDTASAVGLPDHHSDGQQGKPDELVEGKNGGNDPPPPVVPVSWVRVGAGGFLPEERTSNRNSEPVAVDLESVAAAMASGAT